MYIGDLCTVLSKEHVVDISWDLNNLKNNYGSQRHKAGRSANSSPLYTTMNKLIEGPFLALANQMKEIPGTTSDSKPIVQEKEGKAVTEERRETETTEARAKEALAEIERLEALLAQQERQTPPPASLVASRVALFSAPVASQAHRSLRRAAASPSLTKYNYAS